MAALDPQLQERVYAMLKEDYLVGLMKPGEQLDLQKLSDRFKTSKTPLREAACRLMGEGLLDRHEKGGFTATVHDGAKQVKFHAWSAHLMLGLVQVLTSNAIGQVLGGFAADPTPVSKVEVVRLTSLLFERLASASGNFYAIQAVRSCNEQLHYLRVLDDIGLAEATRELHGLINPAVSDLQKAMKRRIFAYHERRIAACSNR